MRSWSEMGRAFVILKKYEKAVEAFDEFLALKPDSVDILFEKGLALSHLKKLDSALEAFNRCIELGLE